MEANMSKRQGDEVMNTYYRFCPVRGHCAILQFEYRNRQGARRTGIELTSAYLTAGGFWRVSDSATGIGTTADDYGRYTSHEALNDRAGR